MSGDPANCDHYSQSEPFLEAYRHSNLLKVLFLIILVILAISSVAISITVSGYDISFVETYRTIIDHILGNPMDADQKLSDYIVWDMNLPRALFAVLAGFSLAVGGTAMQNVMKNPLADPYTTGISSGACLGMSLATVLGLSIYGYGSSGVLITTFVFALIPLLLVVFILPKRAVSVATLILIGIAISYFFNAANTVLLVSTDAETLQSIYNWQVGTLANLSWDSIPMVAVITVFGSIVMWIVSRQMNVLALGDEEASSLGVNVELYRTLILLILSVMVAVVVAYAGIIGFVGLVAPHIARSLIGANNRFLIPIAGMLGGVFLVFSDIMCRVIRDSYLPAGVMVMFIGSPFFIYIVLKSKVIRCGHRSMRSLGRTMPVDAEHA